MKAGEEHFLIPKGRVSGSIDQTGLAIPKATIIRDAKYLASANGRYCMADPGHDRTTVVAAHISCGGTGGKGIKAGDDLVLWLCYGCHREFDGAEKASDVQGALWIVRHIVLPQRREAYADWLSERKRA